MSSPAHPDPPSRARQSLAAVAMTLAGWLVAFGIVTALLTLFGDELGSLPLAPRALVISGVLVTLMVNLVMPVLNAAIARWIRPSPRTRVPVDGGESHPSLCHHPVDGYPIDVGMGIRMGDLDTATVAKSSASESQGCASRRPRPETARPDARSDASAARRARALAPAYAKR